MFKQAAATFNILKGARPFAVGGIFSNSEKPFIVPAVRLKSSSSVLTVYTVHRRLFEKADVYLTEKINGLPGYIEFAPDKI